MKLRFLLSIFSLLLAVTFMSNSGGRAASDGGDNTGSPNANGAFCQSCHSSGAFAPSVTIEVLEPGTGTAITAYIPGTAYDLKITVAAGNGTPTGFGSQTSVLDANNSPVNNLTTPSSNAQITTLSATDYLEHDGISSTGEFTATWTAPTAGVGSVTFYTGANAVDGGGSTGGDGSTSGTLTLTEGTASSQKDVNKLAIKMNAYPNPVDQVLNLEMIGTITGKHTLNITDRLGRVVNSDLITINSGENNTTIEVGHLSTGIYQVSLMKDGKIATLPIFKK